MDSCFVDIWDSAQVSGSIIYFSQILVWIIYHCIWLYNARALWGPGGTSIFGGRRGLAPKFASELLVGAPNFASKNICYKYPKFCPLNFRYDCKIGTFPQLLRLVVTELPKIFLLFGELGWTLPQILPSNLMWGPSPPPPYFRKYPYLGYPCLGYGGWSSFHIKFDIWHFLCLTIEFLGHSSTCS